MKKFIFLLLSTLVFLNIGYTQSSNTDVPPPPPPPRPPCMLLSINPPCCIDRLVYTKEIANPIYNRPNCEAVFTPELIDPAAQPPGDKRIPITATLNGVSITREIIVVNTQPLGPPLNLSFDFSSLQNALKAVFSYACKVGGGEGNPTGQISVEAKQICCPALSPCVRSSDKYQGDISFSFGASCHLPIPFLTIPGIASIDFVASASLSFQIGVNGEVLCTTTSLCFPGQGSASFGVGGGFTLLAGFIQADLQGVTGASISGELCLKPQLKCPGTLSFDGLKIVGTVTSFFGFVSTNVEVELIDPSEFPFEFC